jgi:hypothetical protein
MKTMINRSSNICIIEYKFLFLVQKIVIITERNYDEL